VLGFIAVGLVMMTSVKARLSLVLFVFGAVASVPALAWHHGGRAHIGVFIGAPGFWYPPYDYPPYYPPLISVPSPPPTYIEQGGAQAMPAPEQSNWWYYCADAKAYYPYVKECPSGWQPVAPQPATPAPR
jgi:hypothetical protein